MKPNVIHYSRLSPEPIEVTNAFELNGNLYAVVKYLSRAGFKDLESKDVQKSIDFLRFELEYNTQRYSTKSNNKVDLDTLWPEVVYRKQIVSILSLTKKPLTVASKISLGIEYESERFIPIIIELEAIVKQLKKEGK